MKYLKLELKLALHKCVKKKRVADSPLRYCHIHGRLFHVLKAGWIKHKPQLVISSLKWLHQSDL